MTLTAYAAAPADLADAPVRVGRKISVQSLDASRIKALPPDQWDRLSRAALVENPFHDRRQVLAALATTNRGKPMRALAFYTSDGVLVGLFLFQPRGRVPAPFAVANGVFDDYLVSSTPLVDAAHAEAIVGAWLDAIRDGRAPGLWSFADIDLKSPLMDLINRGVAARFLHRAIALPYERAFLTRLPGGFDAHLEGVLSKNRLKDVRRTMRRLGETGTITFEHAETPELLARRLEDFLGMEHSGWKGQAGTSFLSNPTDAEFARRAYVHDLASIDSLLLEGKPIAMKLSVRTGKIAFTPKIAYDETYRKLGPGMALEYLLLEDFYSSDRLLAVDAAATAKGHSALNFFNEHKPMGTFILGRRAWQVTLLARLNAAREALKTQVVALRARLQGLRRGAGSASVNADPAA